MSIVQATLSRLRRTFSWSNSRQAWEERLGVLVFLAGGFAAWWFGGQLLAWQQVLVWSLVALVGAVLLRRGWLKLFGPVLFYEIVRAARRRRYFFLRFAYVLLLLFCLFLVSLEYPRIYEGELTHNAASEMAMAYFNIFMVIQWVAVGLLTPAFVAGTVSEEKDRKTLEFLLATDLRNREIVLSKLFARLLGLSLFLLAGLPILSALQFLGGVDPNLVLAGFAALGMTMLGLGGVSILNSVQFKRPRDAIGITYLYVVAYVGVTMALYAVAGKIGGRPGPWHDAPLFGQVTLGDVAHVLSRGNPIAVLVDLVEAMDQRGGLTAAIPTVLRDFAIFHGCLAAVTIGWAVLRLRAIALRQAYGRTRRAGVALLGRPPVGDLPMLWKELNVEGGMRLNWLASIVLSLLILASIAPGLAVLFRGIFEGMVAGEIDVWFTQSMNVWVRMAGGLVMFLFLLGVALRSSTVISNERERQTWDTLMTSPLSAGSILGAKFLGCVFSLRLAWIWLGIIWFLGLVTGGLHWFALPLVLLAFFVYASFFAMLGLFFSMAAKTSMRATVYTVLSTIGFMGGHWLIWCCCAPILSMTGSGGAEQTIFKIHLGFTPLAVLFINSFCANDFAGNSELFGTRREFGECLGSCLFGLVIWGVATLIFWMAVLLPTFRRQNNRLEQTFPEAEDWPEVRAAKGTDHPQENDTV